MSEHTFGDPDRDWGGGWDETRCRQQISGLAVEPTERLRWLEEMIRFAHRTGALPRRRDENGEIVGGSAGGRDDRP